MVFLGKISATITLHLYILPDHLDPIEIRFKQKKKLYAEVYWGWSQLNGYEVEDVDGRVDDLDITNGYEGHAGEDIQLNPLSISGISFKNLHFLSLFQTYIPITKGKSITFISSEKFKKTSYSWMCC